MCKCPSLRCAAWKWPGPPARASVGRGCMACWALLKVNQNCCSPDPGLCCSSSSTWPSVTAHVVVLTALARARENVGYTGEDAAMQTRYQDADGLNLALRWSTCGGITASGHGPELWGYRRLTASFRPHWAAARTSGDSQPSFCMRKAVGDWLQLFDFASSSSPCVLFVLHISYCHDHVARRLQ